MEKKRLVQERWKKILITIGMFFLLFQMVPVLAVNALEGTESTEIETIEVDLQEEDNLEVNELEVVETEEEDKTVQEISSEVTTMNELFETFAASIEVSSEYGLNQAIANAEDGVETKIVITSLIEVDNPIIVPANKNIILSASAAMADTPAIIRSDSLHNVHYYSNIIKVEPGATLTTENIVISGLKNEKGETAIALIVNRGTYIMNDGTVIEDNRTRYIGGGIENEVNSVFIMNGGIIRNNENARGAGIYGWMNSTMTFYGGEISGNIADPEYSSGEGAGIYSQGSVSILGDILIQDNYASGAGGGVAVHDGQQSGYDPISFNMTAGRILNNTAGCSGGGISFSGDFSYPTMTISGGEISGNTAETSNGGGISFVATNLEVGNATFKDNTAYTFGGAISVSSLNQVGTLKITGGIFDNNKALEKYQSTGGAIMYGGGQSLIITGGEFTNNTAKIGGAVFTSAETLIEGDNSPNSPYFEGNQAEEGGAIYVEGDMTWTNFDNALKTTIRNITIKDNHALDLTDYDYYYDKPERPIMYPGNGGGIQIGRGGVVILEDVVLTENTASTHGDAVSFRMNDDYKSSNRHSFSYNRRLVVVGDTQIGLTTSDNGVYLPTIDYNYQYYELCVSIDGSLGEEAHINIEHADLPGESTSLTGRLVAQRLDESDGNLSVDEEAQIYYQGTGFKAVINTKDKTQSILRNTEELVFEIIDDFRTEDGMIVIYRTGATGETSFLFPSGYPSQHNLVLQIDGEIISAEALAEVTWTVEGLGGYPDPDVLQFVEIADGSNIVTAKKSGIVELTADYQGNTASIIVVIPGDVSRDGRINTTDAGNIQKYSESVDKDLTILGVVDEFTLLLADVNGDGVVNTADATVLQKMSDKSIAPSN